MFVIDSDLTMHVTRGDAVQFNVRASIDGIEYIFRADEDIIRFKVFAKKNCTNTVLKKDVVVTENSDVVLVELNKDDTTIGEIINKPTDYWYEVELNPDTEPQTIIGYDEDGAKVFKLYPEGGVVNE